MLILKKSLIFALLMFFLSCVCAYAESVKDFERVLKQRSEIAENMQQSNIVKFEDLIKENQTVKTRSVETMSSKETWFSKDPADIEPLRGGKWSFTYTLTDTTYTRVITFGSDVVTSSDSVGLPCTDDFGDSGFVFYTELLGGGRGFVAMIDNSTFSDDWINYFNFNITGTSAQGDLYSQLNGELLGPFPMTGMCIAGCPSENLPGDANQDGKLDMQDVIYLLQLITGIDH